MTRTITQITDAFAECQTKNEKRSFAMSLAPDERELIISTLSGVLRGFLTLLDTMRDQFLPLVWPLNDILSDMQSKQHEPSSQQEQQPCNPA